MTDLRELRRLEPQFFRAPSAHNAQPWLLRYTAAAVELGFDPERALPVGDPTRRDLFLSLGALVEAVLIAGAASGIAVRFEPAVDVPARTVGAFLPAAAPYETSFTPDDLLRRQTSRLAYSAGRLADGELADARAAIGGGARVVEVPAEALVELYAAADRRLYDSPPVVEELRSWLRLSPRHPRYRQDGLTYECLGLARPVAAALSLLLRPHAYPAVRATRVHRAFTRAGTALLGREGSVLVLAGAGREPADTLAHGRSLLRVWLALSRHGLHTHPLSQILDCPATERKLAALVEAGPGEQPLSVFRAGRSQPPARSHRIGDGS